MKTTIILCTYNRCKSLAKTLESIAILRDPGSVEWEVLVVDNNSTDQTGAVVEGYCCRYPGRFRYLFEAQQGKSYALNAGIGRRVPISPPSQMTT
jgi:glucosyl-dolichyl phosphate glucuronosyltransferase